MEASEGEKRKKNDAEKYSQQYALLRIKQNSIVKKNKLKKQKKKKTQSSLSMCRCIFVQTSI